MGGPGLGPVGHSSKQVGIGGPWLKTGPCSQRWPLSGSWCLGSKKVVLVLDTVDGDVLMWDVVMRRHAKVLLVLVVTWQHDEEVGVGGDTLRWFWWCWTEDQALPWPG